MQDQPAYRDQCLFLNILEMSHHLCRCELHFFFFFVKISFPHNTFTLFWWQLRIALHSDTFSSQFWTLKCPLYFSIVKLHNALRLCPNYKAVIVLQQSAIKTLNSFHRFPQSNSREGTQKCLQIDLAFTSI